MIKKNYSRRACLAVEESRSCYKPRGSLKPAKLTRKSIIGFVRLSSQIKNDSPFRRDLGGNANYSRCPCCPLLCASHLSSGRINSVKYFGGLPYINVVHAPYFGTRSANFSSPSLFCAAQSLKMPCYTHSIFCLSNVRFVVYYQIKLSRNSGWP